jgi:hypothetical protein
MTRRNSMKPTRIAIPTANPMLKRWVEWLGYSPESMSPQAWIMRLDLPNGFRGRYPEPSIDAASLATIRVLPI